MCCALGNFDNILNPFIVLISWGCVIFAIVISLRETLALSLEQSYPQRLAIVAIAIIAFPITTIIPSWSGFSHPNALAGLIPWNDAGGYYTCALEFIHSDAINPACTMRPFYSVFLSILLWLSNTNLASALLTQAVILSLAVMYFTSHIWRSCGTSATISAWLVLFLFAAQYCNGLTLTENIGLILGCLAFALMWQQAERPNVSCLALVFFLLCLGMQARSGAMFIFPALIGWLISTNIDRCWKVLTAATVGIATAFAFIPLIAWLVDGGVEQSQSNFSYILYALSSNAQGTPMNYLRVFNEHPEIFENGATVDAIKAAYLIAIDNIVTNPITFLQNYIKGGINHLQLLLHYIDEDQSALTPLRAFFILAWFVGIGSSIRHFRRPHFGLLAWSTAGILISSPFLSPFGGNRIFAVTIPVDALLVATGTKQIWVFFGKEKEGEFTTNFAWKIPLFAAVAMILCVTFLIQSGDRRAIPIPGSYYHNPCVGTSEPVWISPRTGTLALNLTKGSDDTWPFSENITPTEFVNGLHKHVASKESLSQASTGQLFFDFGVASPFNKGLRWFHWDGPLLNSNENMIACVSKQSGSFFSAVRICRVDLPSKCFHSPN